jgi:hypothetical protein
MSLCILSPSSSRFKQLPASKGFLPDVKKLGYALETLLLGESGELALIGFDAQVLTLTDFTSDPDKIDATLEALKFADGSGKVSDAAMAGINLLRNRPATRQPVLILISEGRDKGNMSEVREVSRRSRRQRRCPAQIGWIRQGVPRLTVRRRLLPPICRCNWAIGRRYSKLVFSRRKVCLSPILSTYTPGTPAGASSPSIIKSRLMTLSPR